MTLRGLKLSILFILIFALGFISCNHSGTQVTSGPATEPKPETTPAPEESPEGTPGNGPSTNADKTPTLYDEFVTYDSTVWNVQKKSPGDVVFNNSNPDAVDKATVKLFIKGDPDLGSNDFQGPGLSANQISTKELLSFGTYRSSLKAASCSNNTEEVISAMFLYWEEGEDKNKNGQIDYTEIDIEIACSAPEILEFSVYSQLEPAMRKVSRIVNMATGEVWQTKHGEENVFGASDYLGKPIVELPVTSFNSMTKFYEMGFDWSPDSVRYFIVIDGKEITLWNFKDSEWKNKSETVSYIPKDPASFMFNVWHSKEIWFGDGGSGDYPSKDAILEVDWTKYWAE